MKYESPRTLPKFLFSLLFFTLILPFVVLALSNLFISNASASYWNLERDISDNLNMYFNNGVSNFPSALQLNSNGDLRARRMIDMDNANYLVDPASTSTINGLTVSSGPYTSDWFRITSNANGVYWENLGMGLAAGTCPGNESCIYAYGNKPISIPRYYDNNDTTWYLDPSGTSLIKNLTLSANGAIINMPEVSTNTSYSGFSGNGNGLMGDGVPYYWGIGREPGAWNGTVVGGSLYPDLVIHNWTGVRLAAHSGYGGVSIYESYNGGSGSSSYEQIARFRADPWGGTAINGVTLQGGSISGGNISGNVFSGYQFNATGQIQTNEWFRLNGDNGIYWNTWGGGWRMVDNIWLRSYNGKSIYSEGGQIATPNIQISGNRLGWADQGCTGCADSVNGYPNLWLTTQGALYLRAPGGLSTGNGISAGSVASAGTITGSAYNALNFNYNGWSTPNGTFRLTPNVHLNTPTGQAMYLNWDNGLNYGMQFAVANGVGGFAFRAYGNGDTITAGAMGVNGYGPMGCGGYAFCLVGSTWVSGGYGASDIRLKHDIAPITGALDRIMNLKGVTYRYNEDQKATPTIDGKRFGFIAQDAESVIPEAVSGDDKGFKGIDYGSITALLTEGVKEQQTQIDNLNRQLKQKDNEIKSLKEDISILKQEFKELKTDLQ